MEAQPRTQQIVSTVLAVLLWLVSFGLGLNAMYLLLQIFYLVFGALGGSLNRAERFAPGLIFLLGLAFLIFIVATSEYHRKHVGTRESWRLFAWTIGVEIGITILYYLL
ncbi:MAG TPA: hypothetical protein VFR47_19175 [Anaerolineales bacterium]|nr:hypothetical protein [Anaerolineales bacterium]